MEDARQQLRESQPVILDGPVPLATPLAPAIITALAAIPDRRRLLRAEVYRRHQQQLLELTYALEHQPAARAAAAAPRDFVRIVSWNIERGLRLDQLASFILGHQELRHLDVLLLNEVDLGMARSGNRHIAAELAGRLGFGYVFGNSYLCLDHGDVRDGVGLGDNRESLHGNAILSRFPFRRAENFSLAITRDKFHSSEKRLGHKKALWAELDTPLGPLPVAAVHLDSYAAASQRGAQLHDLLQKARQRGLQERMVLGGDLNTTTYDAGSLGQIGLNLFRKLVRGGFPHAIHHYLHPDQIYERPVFAELEAADFDYRSFNALGVGTTRYVVGSFESESKVSDLLPDLAVKILRYKLRPWNGVAALKVDWFAGRGLEVLQGPGGSDNQLARPCSPTAVARPALDGVQISDHDPILVDLRF